MEIVEINFCPLCSYQIKSKRLYRFWQSICTAYVITLIDPKVELDDQESIEAIDLLEKKGALYSHETDEGYLCRPNGIERAGDACFVCFEPDIHMEIINNSD